MANITVTVLGAGQYFLTPGDVSFYNSEGNVIQTKTTTVILDLGRGCLRTLTEKGISVHDIDALCISHLHPDHVADVLAFLQTHLVEYKKMQERRNKQLQVIGPKGTAAWVKTQLELLFEDSVPYQPVVHEQPRQLVIGDVTIHTALLAHSIPDIGFRLEAVGKTIAYSGDTGATPALDTLANKADLLILECANDPGKVNGWHLTPEECGRIATQTQTKHLLLTHYGSAARKPSLEEATRKHFHGILTFAHTGDQLCL